MAEINKLLRQESVGELTASPDVQVIEEEVNDNRGPERSLEKSPFQDFLFELREAGIRASTSEWLDLQRMFEAGAVKGMDSFYSIARSLLVKRVSDYAMFNEVFVRFMAGYVNNDMEEEPEDDAEEVSEPADECDQKDPENIEEVVESDSRVSESVHGGDEATKDILGSPNAADAGEKEQEHGAEQDLKPDGTTQDIKGERDKEEVGSLQMSKRPRSLKERLNSREIEKLGRASPLTREQIGIAFAELSALMRNSSEMLSRKLDAKETVRLIAKNAGIPRLSWEDSIEVKPKMMILFDVGGSTDMFRPIVEELFAAVKDHIDELNIYYFHNAPYGEVWPQSDGNWPKNLIPIERIIDKDPSTNVIIIGDAWMAPEELWDKGFDGANRQPADGMETLRRIKDAYENTVWVNPIFANKHNEYDNSGTISDLKTEFDMYDLSLAGLSRAVTKLMGDNAR